MVDRGCLTPCSDMSSTSSSPWDPRRITGEAIDSFLQREGVQHPALKLGLSTPGSSQGFPSSPSEVVSQGSVGISLCSPELRRGISLKSSEPGLGRGRGLEMTFLEEGFPL